MTASTWAPAVAFSSALLAAALLAFGWLVAAALLPRRQAAAAPGWTLALPGVVVWALGLMVVHMATGGRVFSNPWVVRAATIAAAVGLGLLAVRRRTTAAGRSSRAAVAAGALLLVAVAVWAYPVARSFPLLPTKDITWHVGWAGQILNGETTPTGPITGSIPNYYPWMFHALLAFVSAFTPSGNPMAALSPVQVLLPAGAALAFFGLGRAVGPGTAAGAGTAALAVLAGGFGWVGLSRPDVLVGPPFPGPRGALTYGGDLLFVRSPSAPFSNLAPPLPRDLAYALAGAALLLLVAGVRERSPALFAASGVVLGVIALTSSEWFLGVAGAAALLVVLGPGTGRLRAAAAVALPALAVASLWLVPLLVSYRRLGGFVHTTVIEEIRLPPSAWIVAWGVATPFAVWGVVRVMARFRRDPVARVPAALVVVGLGVVLGAAVVPGLLGRGFEVVGRQHRYLPVLGLGVAVLGGIGLGDGLWRIGRWSRPVAAAAALLVLLLAIPSAVSASVALGRKGPRNAAAARALRGEEANAYAAVASLGRQRCVVAAPIGFTFPLFGFTGYRFLAFEHPARPGALEGNLSRIRWRDIYRHVPADAARLRDLATVLEGPPAEAAAAIRRYGVDAVVLPADAPNVGYFALTGSEIRTEPGAAMRVFRVGTCAG